MERERRYNILAIALAAGGVLAAGVVIAGYALNPSTLTDTAIPNAIAVLGGLATLYFASLYQFLRRRWPGGALAILVLISAANLGLLIVQTGGLDSSYFALWLLAIAASGLFGVVFTLTTGGLAVGFVIFSLITHTSDGNYFAAHWVQLILVLAAAGVGEWIWRGGRGRAATPRAVDASGLNQAEVLMNSLADGVIVVDRQLKLQLLNPAAELLTGWDLDSARGIHYRTVFHLKTGKDQDVTDADDPFLSAWGKGQPQVSTNFTMTTKSGKKIALELSISPLTDAAKNISGAVAVFRDISTQKEVERQKDEFVSTASHEMRTPVAAIEGYISLAMNPKVAAIDDRAKGFLDKAHQNTQHLGDLFKDLLSVTQIDEQHKAVTKVPIDLGKLVQDAVADMQFAASKAGLTLTSNSAGAVGGGREITPLYTVMGEPERLREVVMNLMENAIKFTSVGGVSVQILGDDATVTVSVNDTGVGISPDDLPHLFQKFYRIDNSATRTIGGTGLGLYLCRSIIEQYNGRLWAESTPGKGSAFRFSLPRVKNELVPSVPPVDPPTAAAPGPTSPPVAAPAPIAAQAAPTLPTGQAGENKLASIR